MSKTSRDNKKKPKQSKVPPIPPGQPSAAVEAANQPHNSKKEALGPNTSLRENPPQRRTQKEEKKTKRERDVV